MYIENLVSYLPAILVLVAVMVIIVKFGNQLFDGKDRIGNPTLFIITFLFIMVLITHLFESQDWTEDALKILIGLLAGTASVKLMVKNTVGGNAIDTSTINGDVAGRDINKQIQGIQDAVIKMKDSIVTQNTNAQHILDSVNNKEDFLLYFVYQRVPIRDHLEKIIKQEELDDYQFRNVLNCYDTLDALILVFSKPSTSKKAEVVCRDDKADD